jgi:dienelactone hydrolase
VPVQIECPADHTQQPALFYAPPGQTAPAPLLVGLHTWSAGYTQSDSAAYATWCIQKGWAFVAPHFRGPNGKPQATGSELAVADVLAAVEYAKAHAKVDPKRVYLVGASGGGHMALLMAGRAPGVWAAVSAWVPISDLAAWHRQCTAAGLGYAKQIAASCGGAPGASAAVDLEYRSRSPLTWLAAAKDVPLDINAGIRDGHGGSVPISHSLNAFNLLAAEADRLAEADIQYLVEKAEVPPHLQRKIEDPLYGGNVPLLRRTSGKTRVTIFKGGHQIVVRAALSWLQKQQKD